MKNREKEKQRLRIRHKRRIRKKISGMPERPRLVVFRSNRNISAQLVDDVNQRTLVTVTSVSRVYDSVKQSEPGKIALSRKIGGDTAEAAKKLNITRVVFDRNGYHYHGRVKAVAEAAREGGLEF